MQIENLTYNNLQTVLKFISTVIDLKLSNLNIPWKSPQSSNVYLDVVDIEYVKVNLMNISGTDNYHDHIFSYGDLNKRFPTSYSMNRVITISMNDDVVLNMSSFDRMQLMKCDFNNLDAIFMQYCLLYDIGIAFEMCIASFMKTCYSTLIDGTFSANTTILIRDKYLHFMEMYIKEHGGN